jgi:lupus La protein
MSNLTAETKEPDPAATSLPNDGTVIKEGGDPSASTDKEVVMAAVESEDANGAAEIKEEQTTEKSEAATDIKEDKSDKKAEENGASGENKERFDDNGVLKTSAQIDETRKNYSKYDPAVLPTTDDPSKIRAQVCNNVALLLPLATDSILQRSNSTSAMQTFQPTNTCGI